MIIHYTTGTFVNTERLNEDDLYSEIFGEIFEDHPTDPDLGGDDGVPAGKLVAYYLDIEAAIANGVEFWDVFDATGRGMDGLLPYYHAIYNGDGEVKEGISELSCGINLLIIDEIDLDPLFQNSKTRLTAVWETMRKFGHGCSLVLLQPYPTGVEDLSPEEIKAAIEEQILEFKRLGFQGPVGDNVLYLDRAFTQPTPQEAGI